MREEKCALLGFLLLLQVVTQCAAQDMTVDQLLEKYNQSLGLLGKRITRAETVTENYDTARGDKPLWGKTITEVTLDRDTERYNSIYTFWFRLEDKNFDAPPYQKSRRLWDGKAGYSNWHFKGDDPRNLADDKIVMTYAEQDKHRKVVRTFPSSPLYEGVLEGDEKSLITIISEADHVNLRPATESISGSQCYVIEASGQNGQYTVWLDPEHGYHPAKIHTHKTINDTLWGSRLTGKGQPLPDNQIREEPENFITTVVEYDYIAENIEFEKVEDVWVPIETEITIKTALSDGTIYSSKKHLRLTHVDLNPDFDAIDAFVAKIPDGTQIIVPEIPGIRYMWQEGELIPNLDELVIDSLDRMIQEEKSRPKAGFAVVTDKKVEPPRDKSSAADTQPDTRPDARPETTQTQRGVPLGFASFPASVLILIGLLSIAVIGWMMFRKFKRSNYVNL